MPAEILSSERVREIAERAEKAVDGPWNFRRERRTKAREDRIVEVVHRCSDPATCYEFTDGANPCCGGHVVLREDATPHWANRLHDEKNWVFIAAARADVPALTASHEALRERNTALEKDSERSQSARKHTHGWYARHYGKLQDWARKRLPDPWVGEFFNCVANGTWGHEDVGKPYLCNAGFMVTPSGHFRIDTGEGQMIVDQTKRAEDAELLVAALEKRVAELEDALNTPELHDFSAGVVSEAQHQRERWGTEQDAGKTPADWFWLVGYLAGKALSAQILGNLEKALHHTISTAAVLANWHAAILGKSTAMRPGIDTPETAALSAREGEV